MSISPPRPKGPPLNALRAFEAAARLGGFAAAADELCVTPGAIAQHIKALESWAGAPLFERRSKGVAITPLAGGVLSAFSLAFDQLGEAVQTLRARAAPQHIRIAALPSIAQLWLSPRLPDARALSPDTTISVTAMETPPNLLREPFDLSIFFKDLPAQPDEIILASDVIFPVCAPELAARLVDPSALENVACLHDSTWADDWKQWLGTQVSNIKVSGPVYSLYSLALEEAKNGAGVLMGHSSLVAAQMASGELVAPFQKQLVLQRALCVSLVGSAGKNKSVRAVVNSLAGQDRL